MLVDLSHFYHVAAVEVERRRQLVSFLVTSSHKDIADDGLRSGLPRRRGRHTVRTLLHARLVLKRDHFLAWLLNAHQCGLVHRRDGDDCLLLHSFRWRWEREVAHTRQVELADAPRNEILHLAFEDARGASRWCISVETRAKVDSRRARQ